MTRVGGNIGHFDAISRRVVGALAVLAGVASLNGFFWSMGFLTWVLFAMMIALGFFISRGPAWWVGDFRHVADRVHDGRRSGSLRTRGRGALIRGAVGFITAEIGGARSTHC